MRLGAKCVRNGVRAVLDTNIWVSAVINPFGAPARAQRAFRAREFTLVSSEPLLEEAADVLSRPRLARKYRVTTADIEELITYIRERAEIVEVFGTVHVCRDPDDDMVIETAIAGSADVVVTGDADLGDDAAVVQYLAVRGIKVWSVARFVQVLDEREAEDR